MCNVLCVSYFSKTFTEGGGRGREGRDRGAGKSSGFA